MGCPLPNRPVGLGSFVNSPSEAGGGVPAENAIFGILLGHRTLLADRQMRFFAQYNAQNEHICMMSLI